MANLVEICVGLSAVSTTTMLAAPFRYPQPGVTASYLYGSSYPDYCPIM